MVDDEGETRAERNERFGIFVEIPEPEPPDAVEHVWRWFWEWSRKRKTSDEAMGWAELQAWYDLTKPLAEPYELIMMSDMDAAYVNSTRSSRKKLKQRSEDRANAFK